MSETSTIPTNLRVINTNFVRVSNASSSVRVIVIKLYLRTRLLQYVIYGKHRKTSEFQYKHVIENCKKKRKEIGGTRVRDTREHVLPLYDSEEYNNENVNELLREIRYNFTNKTRLVTSVVLSDLCTNGHCVQKIFFVLNDQYREFFAQDDFDKKKTNVLYAFEDTG